MLFYSNESFQYSVNLELGYKSTKSYVKEWLDILCLYIQVFLDVL